MKFESLLRKFIWSMLCLMVFVHGQGIALGEEYFKWEEEYRAYGRTIKVSVDISVPEKKNFPLLSIKPMDELSAGEWSAYADLISTLDENVENDLINKMNKVVIYYRDHNLHPDLSDAEKVTTPYRTLLRYDRNTAYAEDNDLTVQEAEEITNHSIQAILPSVSYMVKDIIVNGRTKYRDTGEKLRSKGYYEMYCIQEIDGIPIVGSVHNAYLYDRVKQDRVIGNYGTAYVLVTDRNNIEGTFTLWAKVSELGTADQLLTFDNVKYQIENQIMSGDVRNVYHVYLGYAQYDLPGGEEYKYVLAPAWVVWVDFMDSPEEETEKETVNETGAYMERNTYKPIIINAITGEATNPLNTCASRMLLPASCMELVEGF